MLYVSPDTRYRSFSMIESLSNLLSFAMSLNLSVLKQEKFDSLRFTSIAKDVRSAFPFEFRVRLTP